MAKQQSVKSLTAQMQKVRIEGFVFERVSRGDRGGNGVYGALDDGTQIGFSVPYMKDDDPESGEKIIKQFNIYLNWVCKMNELIKDKERYKLKKFDDADMILTTTLTFESGGKTFQFNVDKAWWKKNHPHSEPPTYYTPEEYWKNAKKRLKEEFKKFEKQKGKKL